MAGKIIGTEKDKTGAEVIVKLADPIGGSPIIPFFYRHFATLIENGHTNPLMSGTNKSKAVYVEIEGKLAGHIVYEFLEDPYKTTWITFSCIEDDYRRRGLYEIMHRHLEDLAKKANSRKIASFVHVNNTVRQASCAKVGMEPVFYRMEKLLEE